MNLDNSLRALREGVVHALAAEHDIEELAARTWWLLQRLSADSAIAGHWVDLCGEYSDEEVRRRDDYFRSLDNLGAIRGELEEIDPSLFDGQEPADDGEHLSSHWGLDRAIKNTVREFLPSDGKLSHWIAVVEGYVARAKGDVSQLSERLKAIREEERLSYRRYRLARRSAGRSAHWLHQRFAPLDTEAKDRLPHEDALGEVAMLIDRGVDQLDDYFVTLLEREIGPNLRRVEAEMVARIGQVASKLSLFERFRQRAQLHERERLCEIAADETRKAEINLTKELALFLFDRGLNPLSEFVLGNQRLDVLDPFGKIYVEAKQYRSSSHAVGNIRQGVSQAFNAMETLAGTPMEVREAFLPVFRWAKEGESPPPQYDLPRELRLRHYRIYLRIVDIAPSSASGRNAGNRIELTHEQLTQGP